LACASGAFAGTYNPFNDFSATNVSGNLWTYWSSNSTTVAGYSGSISLMGTLIAGCGGGANSPCWDQTSGVANLLLQNASGADEPFPNSVAPNGDLTYYTRSGIVLLRFTAPSTSSYSVSGFFQGAATVPESSQDVIAVNQNVGGALLNSSGALAFGTQRTFSFSNVSLNAGDTLDFLVAGVSTTSGSNSIATAFSATITSGAATVPEPGTFGLTAACLGLAFLRLRKRAANS